MKHNQRRYLRRTNRDRQINIIIGKWNTCSERKRLLLESEMRVKIESICRAGNEIHFSFILLNAFQNFDFE